MRVPVMFMAMSVAAILSAAVVVAGEESPDPSSTYDHQSADEVEPDVDAILAAESEVLSEDPQMQTDVEVPELDIDLDNLWVDPPSDTPLVKRFAIGVLRSRVLPGTKGKEIYWERCGAPVAKEDLVREAAAWAATFVAALEAVKEETGVTLPEWGAFATMMNEGGANECSLNFEARKWASEHEGKVLITEKWRGRTVKRKVVKKVVDKFRQTYDRDTVWSIITHPDYKDGRVHVKDRRTGEMKWKSLGNKFDGGVWQMRYSMKKMTRERFDSLTSLHPGVYMGAAEMARRATQFSYRYRIDEPHPRPWMLWQGWNPYTPTAQYYDSKITSVARWLGARRGEIERGFLVLETRGKKNRYRMESKRPEQATQ